MVQPCKSKLSQRKTTWLHIIPCGIPEWTDARDRREMRDTREPDSGEGRAANAQEVSFGGDDSVLKSDSGDHCSD